MLSIPARRLTWLALSLVLAVSFEITARPVLAEPIRAEPEFTARRISPSQTAITNTILVALAPLSPSSPIELVAITLDANLSESPEGHTSVEGNSTFKLHNSLKSDPVTISMGFPDWAGGDFKFNPSTFSSFSVTVDNKAIGFGSASGPLKVGKELRQVNWYAFDLTLNPDEKKIVRADFAQDLGTSIFPRFTYGLLTGSGWKGSIGSARLSLHFPQSTTTEQFVAVDPDGSPFDGQTLTWEDKGNDPDRNPTASFIRFSNWQDLLAKRAAVENNPNDSNSHYALALALSQLASIDSPRRSSFVSQELAELETATRLNPKNVEAGLLLARSYENQAGPATGPRDPAYTALALGVWQNMIGTRADADARRNSAEDSFFLAANARTSGDYPLALKYLNDAQRFSPSGAGPLYTLETWQNELFATKFALAQGAIKDGNIMAALEDARAVFGSDFDLAPAPQVPAFAIDHAAVTSSGNERQISIYLSAFPDKSVEAAQLVSGVITALNRVDRGSATSVEANSEYVITLKVPFNSSKDLATRLDNLAQALPKREDWEVVGAVINPAGVEWTNSSDTFFKQWQYSEQVDLTTGSLKGSLDALDSTVSQLSTNASKDNRAALRLALLKIAQSWWRNALESSTINFDVQGPIGASNHWTMKLGDSQTLQSEGKELRPEWYIVGLGSLLALLLLIGIAFLLARVSRRGRAQDQTIQ